MRCVGLILLAVLALPASALADVNIVISKSQQEMAVSIDGGPSYRWPVSTGRPGYNTPSGSFSAIRLERVYYSKKYDDAPMPNSVFFHGGYAIHGTLEERRLGNAVSHGCVRLARANAAVLYAAVQAHGMSRTHIRITDGPLYDAPVVARGYDERRYRESYEASSRRQNYNYGRTDGRGYRAGPVYRGFEEFDPPRYYHRAPSRRVYWDDQRRRWVDLDDDWRRY
jgi:lipoprotein-anchoring transpeptidase ErfK/SrfK